MALVGVISDTHGQLDVAAYAALAESDVIIHAGDIGNPAILRELETLAPVYAVLGNNDYNEYGAHVGYVTKPLIEGVRFLVAHYPKDVSMKLGTHGALEPGEPIPRIRIHGHTHLPKLKTGLEARPSELLLCPGSATRPRSGNPRTVAFIELANGVIQSARIETFSGNTVLSWNR